MLYFECYVNFKWAKAWKTHIVRELCGIKSKRNKNLIYNSSLQNLRFVQFLVYFKKVKRFKLVSCIKMILLNPNSLIFTRNLKCSKFSYLSLWQSLYWSRPRILKNLTKQMRIEMKIKFKVTQGSTSTFNVLPHVTCGKHVGGLLLKGIRKKIATNLQLANVPARFGKVTSATNSSGRKMSSQETYLYFFLYLQEKFCSVE